MMPISRAHRHLYLLLWVEVEPLQRVYFSQLLELSISRKILHFI